MDGGAAVARVLKDHGVPFVFTLCGGHISPILIGCKREGIRVVDVRHEVNTVFAADAVARLTGIPGVAAVTAGPGVTNTITAIKNAQLAQSPLVLLGGATATVLKGRGSLQDIDQMSLIRPHVKWAASASRVTEIVPMLHRAFTMAASGVPGPVFIELPLDLLFPESIVREWYLAKTPSNTWAEKGLQWYLRRHLDRQFAGGQDLVFPSVIQSTPLAASEPVVKRAAKLVESAKRPIMIIGSQSLLVPGEADRLAEAVASMGIPVYLSGMARGLLGADHPLHMRHKRRMALREADLVILCGVPCDFRLDYGNHISRKSTYISVNRSRLDLRKNRRPDLPILGDPHSFLLSLSALVKASEGKYGAWLEALNGRNQAREDEIAGMAQESGDGVNPLAFFKAMDTRLSEGSILVADGGDFVATASYTTQPRGPLAWLDPGVFGTLGVGAGFALGAKLCKPDSDVWIIYGDGSAGYSIAEFDTFVRHGLPVTAIVGNDACWTQIARDQIPMLGDDVATMLNKTDYDQVVEGWGGKGFLLKDIGQAEQVLDDAIKATRAGQPSLVNVHIAATDFRKGSLSM